MFSKSNEQPAPSLFAAVSSGQEDSQPGSRICSYVFLGYGFPLNTPIAHQAQTPTGSPAL